MLDIEVAAAVAPNASIVVYFAPNTDKGFLDAITMAANDTTHKPSVISISWGSPEKNWTGQAMTSFDQAFQTAASLGVTVCFAAGDHGSGDENPRPCTPSGRIGTRRFPRFQSLRPLLWRHEVGQCGHQYQQRSGLERESLRAYWGWRQ